MISETLQRFLLLDLYPLLGGVLAALSCGLLGNFLVLRRQSLMGDAISHAVLPGLVAAFLIMQTRSPLVMFVGAAISALATVVLTEIIKRLGRVEPGAAMGVVFSVLFALGVFLLESGGAEGVDLDADCVLHGNLVSLFWEGPVPDQWSMLLSGGSIESMPRQVQALLITTLAAFAFVGLFFKELRISSFDPGIARVQGINAGLINMVLMTFVAIAAVASFEAVGSILVIAMLICPAATARLLTDRLGTQVLVSMVFSLLASVIGYTLASMMDVDAAGMMAVTGGGLLVATVIFSPSHGVLARGQNQRRIAREVALEDVLGTLWRGEELGERAVTESVLSLLGDQKRSRRALADAARLGLTHDGTEGTLTLSHTGRVRAASIIRRHRLWEGYLVDQAGLSPDHVHDTAEHLEHLDLADRLAGDGARRVDPQGKPIPGQSGPTLDT